MIASVVDIIFVVLGGASANRYLQEKNKRPDPPAPDVYTQEYITLEYTKLFLNQIDELEHLENDMYRNAEKAEP